MAPSHGRTPPPTYLERLRTELDALRRTYKEILTDSQIHNVDPNRSGSAIFFVGAVQWDWAASDGALEQKRMALLGKVRSWAVLFRLLFAHPTPTVQARIDDDLGLLERWLVRDGGDHSVPPAIDTAQRMLDDAIADLHQLLELLPRDQHTIRLVVDTNSLINDPDLARYRSDLGPAYLVHLLPVVLGEIDNLKLAGRTPELREAARKANKRLKGLRDNGDVTAGARVAGEVHAVFDFREPSREGLPSWLDLSVPDDRLVAACMRLQSDHPGSALYVATSDINLQTKLAAVGLPFVDQE